MILCMSMLSGQLSPQVGNAEGWTAKGSIPSTGKIFLSSQFSNRLWDSPNLTPNVFFFILWRCNISDYIALNGRMIRQWNAKDLEGNHHTRNEICQHLPGGTEKYHRVLVRITGVLAEIWTENLHITNLKRCPYTSMHGVWCCSSSLSSEATCPLLRTNASWRLVA